MIDEQNNSADTKKETIADLKNEPHKEAPVQKGYNEKNPTQPEGAFKTSDEANDAEATDITE